MPLRLLLPLFRIALSAGPKISVSTKKLSMESIAKVQVWDNERIKESDCNVEKASLHPGGLLFLF